jgi:hypothetical protein
MGGAMDDEERGRRIVEILHLNPSILVYIVRELGPMSVDAVFDTLGIGWARIATPAAKIQNVIRNLLYYRILIKDPPDEKDNFTLTYNSEFQKQLNMLGFSLTDLAALRSSPYVLSPLFQWSKGEVEKHKSDIFLLIRI